MLGTGGCWVVGCLVALKSFGVCHCVGFSGFSWVWGPRTFGCLGLRVLFFWYLRGLGVLVLRVEGFRIWS